MRDQRCFVPKEMEPPTDKLIEFNVGDYHDKEKSILPRTKIFNS